MADRKKYEKRLRLMNETLDSYKSVLLAESILDMLVDLVFGRAINKAGEKLAKDPEYQKSLKRVKEISKEIQTLQSKLDRQNRQELEFYFITYGIDLFELDRRSQIFEIEAIKKKFGKYKNIKPLDKKQQELNRKLVSKK